jgi:hypothetical protein
MTTVLLASPHEPIVPPTTPLQANTDLCAITFAQHILENTNEVVRITDIDLCSNWWPTQHIIESVPGMPHPLCRLCANWLPDIEEIGNIQITATKPSGCGNDWPASKNH